MITLSALSIGEFAPTGDFAGTVHSMFSSALNVRLADGRLIVALDARHHANQPRGILVAGPLGFRFDQWGIGAGDSAASRAGVMRFAGGALAIDWRKAKRRKSDLRSCVVDFSLSRVRAGWRAAVAALIRHPATSQGIASAAFSALMGGVEPSGMLAGAAAYIGELIQSSQELDSQAAARATARLIGFGPGLTPSGDDFLAGFMTALWVMPSRDSHLELFAEAFASGLIRQSARTNDISRGFLADAAQRAAPETLVALLSAIAHGQSADQIEVATRRAASVGAASGADAVAGLLVGLSVWVYDPHLLPILQI